MFFLRFGVPDDESPAEIEADISIGLRYKGHSSSWVGGRQETQYYKILAKAMDPDPLQRYASGKELLEALEAISKP